MALVRSIAAGDAAALDALYERAQRPVFTLVMRMTNDRETAEELTLDVFHDVWRRASSYDVRGGTVLGWIMNQARSRAIDRLRFEQRKKRVDPGTDPQPGTTECDSGELVERQQESHRVRAALGVLTPGERRAIETAFFSDLTYTAVAVRLGEPVGTIKTRIRSALAKLRQALGDPSGEP